MERRRHSLISAFLLSILALPVVASPRWHWEDDFSRRDKDRLMAWIEYADQGLERLMGPLPYRYDVHFHRLDNRGEPVPWANTRKRGRSRAVNFHVDVRHPQADFLADWTAPHELTHLMFPYVGRDGIWFAEGIASYLQYQAMYAAGVHDWQRAIARYRERFERAAGSRSAGDRPIAELPSVIRQTRSFLRMYWGGAAYFLEVDRRLAERHDLRLHDVIRRYLDCCFGSRGDEQAMMRTFDRLSGTSVFTDVYRDTVTRPGFPAWREGVAWLADNPPPLLGETPAP